MKTWFRREYIWWRELALDHPWRFGGGLVLVIAGGIGWGAPAGMYLNHQLYSLASPTPVPRPTSTPNPTPTPTHRHQAVQEPLRPTYTRHRPVHLHPSRTWSPRPSVTPVPSVSAEPTTLPSPTHTLCVACSSVPPPQTNTPQP